MYDYVAGKADWLANGLPSIGTAIVPRAGTLANRDVPTCRLTDTVGAVRTRIEGTGWQVCVVVNDERIVLGLLDIMASADPHMRVGDVMEIGPSTWRLNGSLADIAASMVRHRVDIALISTSDGTLHGALRRADIPGS